MTTMETTNGHTTKKNGSTAIAATTPAPDQPTVQAIALTRIVESPSNPRKTFGDLVELAADVKAHGVLQPVLVRPKNNGFELVFGSRRFRASKLAARETIPCMIRELDDATVLELQVVENSHREDVHPLEEAEGYEQLHKKHGYTTDQIAAKVGKSRAFVYASMKLCALCPEARKAFHAGKLSKSTALFVARIPDAVLQKEAIAAIGPRRAGDDPAGAREAFEIIQKKYMLRLADAPFDRADKTLVAAAGACGDCPKRTGNQKELFADVKSADVCTDPTCFDKKRRAAGERTLADAKKKGFEVIEGKATSKVFDHRYEGGVGTYVRYDSGYTDLHADHYVGGKNLKLSGLIKKAGARAPKVTIAIDGAGQARELIAKSDVPKLLKAAGIKEKVSGYGSSAADKARQKKIAAEQKRKKALARATTSLLVEAAEKKAPTMEQWRCLAHAAISAAWHDNAVEARYRRGMHDATRKGDSRGDLVKATSKMTEAQLRGVVVEMLVYANTLQGLAKAFGVTPAAVKKRVVADAKPAKASKKTTKRK